VAPSELEDLIRRHPGVLDVAVVGVPDERVLSFFLFYSWPVQQRYSYLVPGPYRLF
jgi:acyl-CoA synthetase (AMP-forming)/AMP-acid ligase II